MSVQSEITRLETAKTNIVTAIENKGVTVPSGTKLDGMAALIGSIESGGGGGAQTVTVTLTINEEIQQTGEYEVGSEVQFDGFQLSSGECGLCSNVRFFTLPSFGNQVGAYPYTSTVLPSLESPLDHPWSIGSILLTVPNFDVVINVYL